MGSPKEVKYSIFRSDFLLSLLSSSLPFPDTPLWCFLLFWCCSFNPLIFNGFRRILNGRFFFQQLRSLAFSSGFLVSLLTRGLESWYIAMKMRMQCRLLDIMTPLSWKVDRFPPGLLILSSTSRLKCGTPMGCLNLDITSSESRGLSFINFPSGRYW